MPVSSTLPAIKPSSLLTELNLKSEDELDYLVAKYAPKIAIDNEDLPFFATYYIRPMIADWMAVPEPHNIIYKWLLQYNRLLLEAARDFAKSSLVSLIYPLYRIVKDPNIRILHIAGSGKAGSKFARLISHHLQYNKRLIRDFGPFKNRRDIWQQAQFTVKRTATLKEPTFQSIGWQSAVVGGRFDLIIMDDVEDSRNTKNPEHGADRLQWLENDIFPMLKGGQFIVVQPYQGAHDIHRILRKKDIFVFKKLPVLDKQGKSIWPERMPTRGHLKPCPHIEESLEDFPCEECSYYRKNKHNKIICGYCREVCRNCPITDLSNIVCLRYKEKESGKYNFRRQYLLDETVETSSLFNMEDVAKNKTYKDLPPGSYRCVHGYDLATGQNKKNCKMGYARIFINNHTGNIYVDTAIGVHKKFPDQVRYIKNVHSRYNQETTIHGIEANAYQVVLSDYFALLTTIPVKPIITTQDKFTRALKLTVFYESGRIYHREGACTELEDQLENFEAYGPRKNKDVFDALYLAIQADGLRGEGGAQDVEIETSFTAESAAYDNYDTNIDDAFTSFGSDMLGGFDV